MRALQILRILVSLCFLLAVPSAAFATSAPSQSELLASMCLTVDVEEETTSHYATENVDIYEQVLELRCDELGVQLETYVENNGLRD